jgi:hypothetical protein
MNIDKGLEYLLGNKLDIGGCFDAPPVVKKANRAALVAALAKHGKPEKLPTVESIKGPARFCAVKGTTLKNGGQVVRRIAGLEQGGYVPTISLVNGIITVLALPVGMAEPLPALPEHYELRKIPLKKGSIELPFLTKDKAHNQRAFLRSLGNHAQLIIISSSSKNTGGKTAGKEVK